MAGPSTPDEASYPRRGRAVLTTFLFSIIAMGILSLFVSAVREHTNL
jgi:capsular polysaccharide transport system permease protein